MQCSTTPSADAPRDFTRLSQQDKWGLLGKFLTLHGREALSYATLQSGMEYFLRPSGYIAYTTVYHPVFARRKKRTVPSDPICARSDLPSLIGEFLKDHPWAVFAVVSEACADVLKSFHFKINSLGYEPELPIQTYNTRGNWRELDLIKRARNEAKREGLSIREEDQIEHVDRQGLEAVSAHWIGGKRVNDREIWVYARRPVFEREEGVRKFVAYGRDGRPVGFAFYDPMYRDGEVFGYSANISRFDETRYGKLATAVHMEAMEKFRAEGKEVLNLCLAPFVKLDLGKYNDDLATRWFFQLSERFGNNIYNFKGLSFHKSKYRGSEKPLYYASNSALPSNDVYLAFLSADITRSYWTTLRQLLWGMITAHRAP